MQKPLGVIKKRIKNFLNIKEYIHVGFNKTTYNDLSDIIKKENLSDKYSFVFDTIPYFNAKSQLESHLGYQKHKVTICIFQLEKENYLLVNIEPFEDDIFRVNYPLKKEELIYKEHSYYKKLIEETNPFAKMSLIEEKLDEDYLEFFYSIQSKELVDVFFLNFIYQIQKTLNIAGKEKITNERDYRFLFSIIGSDYNQKTYEEIKELIELIDIRLGSLTKESKELIELNYFY